MTEVLRALLQTSSRPYYSLLSKQRGTKHWRVEFGDYQRQVVVEEQNDYRRGYDGQHFECKIIQTDDDQKSIDAAVGSLNTY